MVSKIIYSVVSFSLCFISLKHDTDQERIREKKMTVKNCKEFKLKTLLLLYFWLSFMIFKTISTYIFIIMNLSNY